MSLKKIAVALSVVGLALVLSARVDGQVGKSLGVVDANVAPEAELLKMPNMTPLTENETSRIEWMSSGSR